MSRPTPDSAPHCPNCGYNLYGLPDNRCPECGNAFSPGQLSMEREYDWDDSLDAQDLRAMQRQRIELIIGGLLIATGVGICLRSISNRGLPLLRTFLLGAPTGIMFTRARPTPAAMFLFAIVWILKRKMDGEPMYRSILITGIISLIGSSVYLALA